MALEMRQEHRGNLLIIGNHIALGETGGGIEDFVLVGEMKIAVSYPDR